MLKSICLLGLSVILMGAGNVSPFSLKQMNGDQQMFNSDDHRGAVYVIENYFESCSYCNDNAPNVDAMATAYKDNVRVFVLDVGIDRRDSQYQSWITRHKPNHPVLNDASRILTNQLGTTGYPSTYVLDCNLNVKFTSTGVWNSATVAEIKKAIELSLGEICYL